MSRIHVLLRRGIGTRVSVCWTQRKVVSKGEASNSQDRKLFRRVAQQRVYALLPADHDGAIVPAAPFDASTGNALHTTPLPNYVQGEAIPL